MLQSGVGMRYSELNVSMAVLPGPCSTAAETPFSSAEHPRGMSVKHRPAQTRLFSQYPHEPRVDGETKSRLCKTATWLL